VGKSEAVVVMMRSEDTGDTVISLSTTRVMKP
jgi:hypothetical protein